MLSLVSTWLGRRRERRLYSAIFEWSDKAWASGNVPGFFGGNARLGQPQRTCFLKRSLLDVQDTKYQLWFRHQSPVFRARVVCLPGKCKRPFEPHCTCTMMPISVPQVLREPPIRDASIPEHPHSNFCAGRLPGPSSSMLSRPAATATTPTPVRTASPRHPNSELGPRSNVYPRFKLRAKCMQLLLPHSKVPLFAGCRRIRARNTKPVERTCIPSSASQLNSNPDTRTPRAWWYQACPTPGQTVRRSCRTRSVVLRDGLCPERLSQPPLVSQVRTAHHAIGFACTFG